MSYEYTNKGKKPIRDWSKVDWSKSTKELAEKYKMRECNISRLRRKHAPKTINKSNQSKLKYNVDWFMVDWSKSTKEIAEEIGCGQATVSQKRRQYAKDTLRKREFMRY